MFGENTFGHTFLSQCLAGLMAQNGKEENDMDRTDFMNHVYWLLSEDSDNNRANSIIDAADEYAESVKTLPPVHQKQTNCEYCHTDRDGYVFPLDKNSHAFIDRDKIVLKANGWRGKAKIKYCPICGRRLTDAVD